MLSADMARKKRTTRKSARPDEVAIFRRRLTVVALLVTMAALVALDRAGFLAAPTSDSARYDGATVSVTRVIDGDTIIVDLGDPRNDFKPTRVRIWGIDTPELARAGAPAEALAIEAKEFAERLIGSQPVTLRLEAHSERDRWGRLLAHVELANGDSFAAGMLEAGLARAEDRWPHQWAAWYARLERDARRSGVGLWAK